jgi:hypothetical protein
MHIQLSCDYSITVSDVYDTFYRLFLLTDTYCYTTRMLQAQVHAVERQLRSLQEERQSSNNVNSKPASVQQQFSHALKVEPAKHTAAATTTSATKSAAKPVLHTMMTDTSNKTVSKPIVLVDNTSAVPIPVPLSKPTYAAAAAPSVDHLDLKLVGKRNDSSGNDSTSSSNSSRDSQHDSNKAVAVHNDFHHDRVKHAVPQASTVVAQQQPTTLAAAPTTQQRSAASWVKNLWNRAKPSSSDQHHGDSKTAAAPTVTSSDKSRHRDVAHHFSSSRNTATFEGSAVSIDTHVDLEFYGVGG